jgi:Mrp family chromosome partitioning ATPase
VFTDDSQTLGVMSIGFLLNNDREAVIWRGPKKNAMIKQFLTDVSWLDRDILIIDTPPGTSDEHITVMENLRSVKVDGAILVTTPQAVAVGDVRREVTFCKKAKLKILGIVENKSGFVCPNCKDCTNIFSKGGGQALAEHAKVPFLGAIPIDPNLALAAESGQNFVSAFKTSPAAVAFQDIVKQLDST